MDEQAKAKMKAYDAKLTDMIKWLMENLKPGIHRDLAYFKLQESIIYIGGSLQENAKDD